MADAFMPHVKNIVFLMFENRSLSPGVALHADAQLALPSGTAVRVSPGSSKAYNGLTPRRYSNPDGSGNAVPVAPISDQVWSGGYAVPYRDPYEALRAGNGEDPRDPGDNWNGVMNQLFGNQNIITGLPSSGAGAPAMQGFLQDYTSVSDGSWDGHDILWTYTPLQANVINSIALEFAVGDRWFCSVPSETNPNRAYSVCATSQGRESNPHWNSEEKFKLPTISNAIASRKSWGLYYSDEWVSGQPYTEYTFQNMASAPNGEICDISRFFSQAAAGTLPTILVSPFVLPGTVFRAPQEDIKNGKYPFDHTSFVKTLLMWAGVYDSQAANFGRRMPQAPTFEAVLADTAVNEAS